jgi:hypothetical protein
MNTTFLVILILMVAVAVCYCVMNKKPVDKKVTFGSTQTLIIPGNIFKGDDGEIGEPSDNEDLDDYLDKSDPLQKVKYNDKGVDIDNNKSRSSFYNEPIYLDPEFPKDTMSGHADSNYDDKFSTFKVVPEKGNIDFHDATGLTTSDSINESESKFNNDYDTVYNQWFQGKKPREYIPTEEMNNPKYQRELEYKQDFTSIGEWTYKNETEMNTGSTGNNVAGYSSFHSKSDNFNNKVNVSQCHS